MKKDLCPHIAAFCCVMALGCAASAQPVEPMPAQPAVQAAETPVPEPAAPPQPGMATATAQPALTLDALLDNMEAARKTLKTFKADVAKTRRIEALDDTEEFTGWLEFKTPRLLRMSLTSTRNKKEIVTYVGKEYAWIWYVKDKRAEGVRLADMKQADKEKTANPLEFGLARDLHGLRDSYELKLLPVEKIGNADTVPLEMTPKKDTYAEGKTILWVDTSTWLPAQVREFKSNDEVVETHTFTNAKTNLSLADKLFEFPHANDPDIDTTVHEAEQK